ERDYTRALIETFAFHREVVLHGCAGLAELAERKMRGEPVSDAAVLAEIEPVFVDRSGRRTDAVVLGCTHYPLLLEELERVAPWPVVFVDPSDAIARRVVEVVPAGVARGQGRAWVSSGDGLRLGDMFARHGFPDTVLIDLPVERGI
ncbi:MAG: glutamate racemase, partial [Hyphomicrobiales bacterium]